MVREKVSPPASRGLLLDDVCTKKKKKKPSVPWIVTIPDPVRLRPIALARIAPLVLEYPERHKQQTMSTVPKGALPALGPGPDPGLGHARVPVRVHDHVRVLDPDRAPTARHRRRTVHRRVRKTTTMLRHDRTHRHSGVRKTHVILCRKNRPEAEVVPRMQVDIIGQGRVRRNRIARTLPRSVIVTCRGIPVDPTLAKS